MSVTAASSLAFFFSGDAQVALNFSLIKPDGTAQDLTGGTVTLIAEGNTNSPFTVTITNATQGQCTYLVGVGTWAAGTYRCQLKTVIGGNIFYSTIFTANVSAVLG